MNGRGTANLLVPRADVTMQDSSEADAASATRQILRRILVCRRSPEDLRQWPTLCVASLSHPTGSRNRLE